MRTEGAEPGARASRASDTNATVVPAGPHGAVLALCLLVPTLAGLAASTVMLNAPVFCADGAGCEVVSLSALGKIGGVPTALFGLVGFFFVGVLTFVRGKAARTVQSISATLGAVFAIYLIYYQTQELHTLCKFCMTADLAMIALAVATAFRASVGWEARPAHTYVAAIGIAAAVGVPLVLGLTGSATAAQGVPTAIRAEQAQTPKGQITIIDYADFECPFCRRMHATLGPILEKYKDRVRLVRRQVPLAMHPHAQDAARAACCADAQAKGDKMADALFSAPPAELTPAGCEKLAASLGLDPGAFHACLGDPTTDARIKAEAETFWSMDPERKGGLPTLWIGQTKIVGAEDAAVVEQTIERELSRAGS